jgi:DNA repair exonuclease SbcCD ATPase subunit
MSIFPFIRNLIGVKEDNAFQIALDAIVKWDPEGSSTAQLLTMEQNLDLIGRRVESARDAYDRERKEFDTIVTLSQQRMSAADLLQRQMDAESDPNRKAALKASLEKLVSMLEELTPNIEREKKDAQAAQEFLESLEQSYNDAATKLKTAKADLTRAQRDMAKAGHEREMAEQRAAQAREAAGLTHSTNALNVALQAMHDAAARDQQAAAAANRKAKILAPSSPEKDDPNIAAAMAAAGGAAPTGASLADRLAALKAKQAP